MKIFINSIKTVKKPEYLIPEKEILWPTEYGDSNEFPEMWSIAARYSSNSPTPLEKFGKAVAEALNRVWIIDPYFLDPDKDKGTYQDRIDAILNWMPETIVANDIRILTKSHNTHKNKSVDKNLQKKFQEHIDIINELRSKGSYIFTIKIRFTLINNFNYIHDRFAIIDDELWHFGATVGGFHSQVNAATRGWKASDHKAEEFFKLAWNAKSIKGKQK